MTKKSRIISRKTNEKSMPSAFRKSFAVLWFTVLTMAESIDKKKDVMTHYFMKTRYFIMLFAFNQIILPERNIFPSEQEAFGRTTKAKPFRGLDFTKKTGFSAPRNKAAFLLRFGCHLVDKMSPQVSSRLGKVRLVRTQYVLLGVRSDSPFLWKTLWIFTPPISK